jgi:CDP-diacylglycerol--glycerol-3-phosphate 3-phosphatidyltransferase
MKFTFTPPNQLTFLRILLTPIFVGFLLSSDATLRQVSLLVFLVALLTDWYDGWVARRWGYTTPWGTFLDPLADKIITSAALIAFIYLDLAPWWAVCIIVVRDLAITFLRSYAEYRGKPIDTKKFAKTKTFLQFVVISYILLLYVGQEMAYIREHHLQTVQFLLTPSIVHALVAVVALLTLWSGILYVVDNWKVIRELYDFSRRVTESD